MTLRATHICDFVGLLALSSGITSIATILIFGDIIFTWVLLIDLIVAIVWVICGILTYGLQKHFWKLYFTELQCPGYCQKFEKLCIDIGMGGLLSLIYSLTDNKRMKKYPLGLCFKMPQELRGQ